MNIIRKSGELSNAQIYFLTQAAGSKPMRTAVGSELEVDSWVIYEDEDSNGELHTIVSILTPEREIFATNSQTFLRDFSKIADIFCGEGGEGISRIKVISGKTKSNREYVTCCWLA